MKKRILLSGLFLMVFLCWTYTGQLLAQSKQSSSLSADDKAAYLEYMNSLRANPLTGTISPLDVQKAWEQVDQMKAQKTTTALGLSWSEVGPDNFAGRTRCMIIDRNNPSVLYAGSTGGGLWKSTTQGTSWVRVNVGTSTNSPTVISSISQGTDNAIYLATGDANSLYAKLGAGNVDESFTYYGVGHIGNGIWKSTDNGATFSQLANTVPASNDTTADFAFIGKVLVHPANANIVYACTRTAFKMSTDGGNTWTTVNSSTATPLTGKCQDVEAHADGTVAVCVGGLLYVSADGSSGTFEKKSNGGSGQLPATGANRLEVAIAPTNSSYIYVVYAGTNCDVYRSINKGNDWSLIGPGGSLSFDVFGQGGYNVGWYSIALAVSPANPDKLYLGGKDLWTWESGTTWVQKSMGLLDYTDPAFLYYYHHAYVFQNSSVFYIATDGGIHKTYDGGSNFMTLNKNLKIAQINSVSQNPDGNVLAGTQGNGTLLFDGSGNTPQTASLMLGNYEDAGSATYFGTDGAWCSYSLLNPEVVFASGSKHRIARSIDKGLNFTAPTDLMGRLAGSSSSYNVGAYYTPVSLWETFNDIYSTDSAMFAWMGGDSLMQTIWVQSNICRDMTFPVAYGGVVHNGDTMYYQDKFVSNMFIGMKDYAFMSRGTHNFLNTPPWWKIAKFSGTSTAIAHSRDGNNCFIGTSNGKIIRVSNIRLATDSLKGDIDRPTTCILDTMQIMNFGNRAVTSITVDIHDANKVLVTLGNYGCNDYVYYTTNALDTTAVTFTSKQGSLPKMPVFCSLIEMDNSNLVFLGTDMGLYATTDITAASPAWTDESDTIGHVPVFALNQMNRVIDAPDSVKYKNYPYYIYNYGSIVMGTHGRGAFRCDKYVGINQPKGNNAAASLLSVYPNPASATASVNVTLKKATDLNLTVYDLQGKRVSSETYRRSAGTHTLTMNLEKLQSGNYIVVLNNEGVLKTGKLVVVK